MNKRIDIAILDDHEIFVESLKALLRKYPHLNVVKSFTKTVDLLEFLKKSPIDVLLLDIDLQDEGVLGYEICEYVSVNYPNVVVSMLTMSKDVVSRRKAFSAGASHFIYKGDKIEDLVRTLNIDKLGQKFIEELSSDLSIKSRKTLLTKTYNLTKREWEIFELAVSGKTNSQIGKTLFISQFTAKTHRTNLLKKLNLNSTAQLMELWHRFNH